MNIWHKLCEQFLARPEVSELEVNGYDSVHIKMNGERYKIENVFESEEEYINSIDSLFDLSKDNKSSVHTDKFIFEDRIRIYNNGEFVTTARCHVVLPPASLVPLVTIAKKTTTLVSLVDILNKGSMSPIMYNFILAAIKANLTIVLSGSTGSGKTTFLEAMTKHWDEHIRVGVAEDAPELLLTQANVAYLKSSPWRPGTDPNDVATLEWCVQQLNRMRVDKIIVGETRGKELFNFLQAANSGCEGSLTTLHATSPKLCLQKMSQFVVQAMPQPVRVANQNIANTVDLIIQLEKMPDGSHKVTSIEEVSDILGDNESATIATTPLTKYNPKTGTWEGTFLISDHLREAFQNCGITNFTTFR